MSLLEIYLIEEKNPFVVSSQSSFFFVGTSLLRRILVVGSLGEVGKSREYERWESGLTTRALL